MAATEASESAHLLSEEEMRAEAHAEAERLLRSKGYSPSRIVAIHVDAILWLNQEGEPRTGLLWRTADNQVVPYVRVVDGFVVS